MVNVDIGKYTSPMDAEWLLLWSWILLLSEKWWIFQPSHVLGGGNSDFLFSPWSLGKWSNLTNIFGMGWNLQLVVSFLAWFFPYLRLRHGMILQVEPLFRDDLGKKHFTWRCRNGAARGVPFRWKFQWHSWHPGIQQKGEFVYLKSPSRRKWMDQWWTDQGGYFT